MPKHKQEILAGQSWFEGNDGTSLAAEAVVEDDSTSSGWGAMRAAKANQPKPKAEDDDGGWGGAPVPAQNQDEDDGGWGGAPVPLSSRGKEDDGGWGGNAGSNDGEWGGGPEATPKAQPARLKPQPSAQSQPQTGGRDAEPVQFQTQASSDDNAGGWGAEPASNGANDDAGGWGAPEPKQISRPSSGDGWGASEPAPVNNGGGGWGQQGGRGNFGGNVSNLTSFKRQ